MSTIQEVYEQQDASDMFFNHEDVTKAYSDALSDQENPDVSLEDKMIKNLTDTFGESHAKVIAQDFLARV